MSEARTLDQIRNVVLVHGGFVDGSGWQGVYKALKKNGYNVSIVQNPTNSLADDCGRDQTDARRAGRPGHSRRSLGTAASWSRRPATIRRSPDSSTSRGSCRDKGESVAVADSRIRRRVRTCRRSCRRRTATYSSTRTKFRCRHSLPTSRRRSAAFMADSQVPWGA